MPGAPSPCNQICEMNAAHGWCRGCGRTLGEIAEWPSAKPDRQRAILAALPARLRAMEAA